MSNEGSTIEGGSSFSHDQSLALLRKLIKDNLENFQSSRWYNERWAFRLRMAIVGLGALTTFAIATGNSPLLSSAAKAYVDISALFFSAAVTLISAWEAFFDYRWFWINYTNSVMQFHSISSDLDFALTRDSRLTDAQIQTFYDRIQAVCHETNDAWAKKRQSQQGQPAGQRAGTP